jgi:hypothetical protein
MSFGKGTHWKGPILGSDLSGGGVFEDHPTGLVDQFRSPYKQYLETFDGLASGVTTDLEGVGWTETAVGTAASRTWAYDHAQGCLIINADTVADEGTSAQFNGTLAAAKLSHQHRLLGPVVSTSTLMDNRELIWATRISFLVGNGSTYDSKALLGWFVTDTGLMTAATGALAIATGGGIGFHISGDAGGTSTGSIDCVTQGTTAAISIASGVSVTTAGTTFDTAGWIDLAFRARWKDADAGTGLVDFYVNGRKVATQESNNPMRSTQTYSNTIELINGPATADQVDMGVEYLYNAISRPGLTYPYSSGLNL